MAFITLDLLDQALTDLPYLIYPAPRDPHVFQYTERPTYRWRTWLRGDKRYAALDQKYQGRWLYVFHLKMA